MNLQETPLSASDLLGFAFVSLTLFFPVALWVHLMFVRTDYAEYRSLGGDKGFWAFRRMREHHKHAYRRLVIRCKLKHQRCGKGASLAAHLRLLEQGLIEPVTE